MMVAWRYQFGLFDAARPTVPVASAAAAAPAIIALRSTSMPHSPVPRLSCGHASANQLPMATDPARITTPERTAEDADLALRPKTLDEFIGQQAARENLRVFVHAAKSRNEPLDHVLLHGP